MYEGKPLYFPVNRQGKNVLIIFDIDFQLRFGRELLLTALKSASSGQHSSCHQKNEAQAINKMQTKKDLLECELGRKIRQNQQNPAENCLSEDDNVSEWKYYIFLLTFLQQNKCFLASLQSCKSFSQIENEFGILPLHTEKSKHSKIESVYHIMQKLKVSCQDIILIGTHIDIPIAKNANIALIAMLNKNDMESISEQGIMIAFSFRDVYTRIETILKRRDVVRQYLKLYPIPQKDIIEKNNKIKYGGESNKKSQNTGNVIQCSQYLHIISEIKLSFPSIRWRQIERLVLFQSLSSNDENELLTRVNHRINNFMSSQKYYPSTVGKAIRWSKEIPLVIEYIYPTLQLLELSLKKHTFLSKYFALPAVLSVEVDCRTVLYEFIPNKQIELNFTFCMRLVDLSLEITKLPFQQWINKFSIQAIYKERRQNFNIWKSFAREINFSQQQQLSFFGLAEKMCKELDVGPKRIIFRDINYLNILRHETNDRLYLVDFQHLSYGYEGIDLAYLISDKYYYLEEEIIQHMINRFYCERENISSRQQFQRLLSYCCFVFTYRWMFDLCAAYTTKGLSFHLDLKNLVCQLMRATFNIFRYLTEEEQKIVNGFLMKVINGFLRTYSQIYYIQNLPRFPDKIILVIGLVCEEKDAFVLHLAKNLQSNQILKIDKIIQKENYVALRNLVGKIMRTKQRYVIVNVEQNKILSFLRDALFSFIIEVPFSKNGQFGNNKIEQVCVNNWQTICRQLALSIQKSSYTVNRLEGNQGRLKKELIGSTFE